MFIVSLDKQSFQVPESWAEINHERLARLLHLLYFTPESPESMHEIIMLALNAKPKKWKELMQKHFSPKLGDKARHANAAVLHELFKLLNWMQTEPIEKQPFPAVTIDKTNLLLPEEHFLTMSFGELTEAYIHFLVYIRQLVAGNEHLDLLVSTLCRPERAEAEKVATNWNGDAREPYNEYLAKERAKLVKHLPEGVKMAILLFFAGNMKRLLEQYKVFGGDSSSDEPEEYPAQGLVKNGHLLAEKGVFGTLQETKSTNVHEVLLFLEEHRNDLLAEQERRKNEQ